jgi:hypothetical protein
MAKKNMLGLPWWLWVGGGALVLYFATRKTAAAPTYVPQLDPTPVPQVVDPEEPPSPAGEYVATQMNGCVGCL